VAEEFEALDLGDPRRDRRAKELLKRLVAKPSEGIPGACDGWAETMAAYRFVGNEEVEWTGMMQPHWDRTAARIQQHAVVPCVADTTELDFKGQDMEGLGPLSVEAQRGMYLPPLMSFPASFLKPASQTSAPLPPSLSPFPPPTPAKSTAA
jgi:hypothetical protein